MRHKNTEPKNLMELNLILHYLFSYCLLLNRFFLFLVVYLYLALNSVVKIYILIHTNTSNLRLINAVCQKRRSSSIKHQLVFKQLQNLSFATVGGFYSSWGWLGRLNPSMGMSLYIRGKFVTVILPWGGI